MTFFALFLIALSLSMDAFALAVGNGVAYGGDRKQAFITALAFGLAQGMMPVAGYLLGSGFSRVIEAYDHWVAFLLLAFIGGKMIVDGLRELGRPHPVRRLTLSALLAQAVATSIDAMAVGVSFAALEVAMAPAAAIIGATTFFCCLVGGAAGARCGVALQRYAVLAGGLILILLGLKILFEHLGVI